MEVIRDIWLCDECCIASVNDDYSGLDYYLSEAQAGHRMKVIKACLANLPGLVPDDADDEMECRDCGHIAVAGSFNHVAETEDNDAYHMCRKCDGDDVRARDSGRCEYLTYDCDCCGNTLGGSRTRFAQIQTDLQAADNQRSLL
jgi:hypothetical protein